MRISDEEIEAGASGKVNFSELPSIGEDACKDLRDLITLRINSQATYDLLLEWLDLHGQHTNECAVHDRKPVTGLEPWPPCTCGLAKLLEGK